MRIYVELFFVGVFRLYSIFGFYLASFSASIAELSLIRFLTGVVEVFDLSVSITEVYFYSSSSSFKKLFIIANLCLSFSSTI